MKKFYDLKCRKDENVNEWGEIINETAIFGKKRVKKCDSLMKKHSSFTK